MAANTLSKVFSALVLLMCTASNATALVTASVDRTNVSLEDTLTLTVSSSDSNVSGSPDTTVLLKDFEILSQQQSNQTTWINGAFSNSKKWIYTLAPKRAGEIRIPPIKVGSESTRSLKITVSKPEARAAGQADIFVESSVSSADVWVMSEVIYTFKLFTAVTFRDASLEDISVDNAIVQPGKEAQYNTRINGRYYQVIERRYSIFPQSSGSLEIPSLMFQASVDDYSNRRSLLAPGRLVRKRSERHEISVKPAPADYPGRRWLPARDLKITETWSDDPEALRTGQSITRTLTIEAEGLLASQLPPQEPPVIDGLKIYPDRGDTEDRDGGNGQTGIRIESQAMIPTRAGEIILPPVEIVWFNTETGTTETARLPQRYLQVTGGAPTGTDPQATANPSTSDADGASQSPSGAAGAPASRALLWTNLAMLVLLVASNVFWWRRTRILADGDPAGRGEDAADARALRKSVLQAIDKQDLPRLRQSLLQWARQHYADQGIRALRDIPAHIPALQTPLEQLEAALYAPHKADAVDLIAIKRAVQKPPTVAPDHVAAGALRPLYPA